MFENVNKILDLYENTPDFPGFDAIIYKDGKKIYRRQFKYDGSEILRVHSCTKPLTAACALQLFEKGLIKLDDPVSKYLPEWENPVVKTEKGLVPADKPITIRMLLTMTSGIGEITEFLENNKTYLTKGKDFNNRDFSIAASKEPLFFQPGTGYKYGYGLNILASIIEVVTGKTFNDYVTENIFEPLNMTNSSIGFINSKVKPNIPTHIINKTTDSNGKNAYTYDQYFVQFNNMMQNASGGLVTNAEDYIKFTEGLRTNKILKINTVDMMATDQMTDEQRAVMNRHKPTNIYGYGFAVRTPYLVDGVDDFGWSGAAGCFMAIDRRNNISLFLEMNTINPIYKKERSLLPMAIKKDLGIDNSLDEIIERRINEYSPEYLKSIGKI